MARPSTGLLTANRGDRQVPLRGRINKQIASCCIARLLVLATEGSEPIITYIDSPGGSVSDALGVISTISGIKCPVLTFCRGTVAGPAVLIAAHGLRGLRAATPDCRFSFKHFETNHGRRAVALDSYFPMLTEIAVPDTGMPETEVLRWLREGIEFSASEAMSLGIIDLISNQPILPSA